MAYTIEGLGRTGERSFIGIEPTPDSALDAALEAESRGVERVTITSSIGWKYSIPELAATSRCCAAPFRSASEVGEPASRRRERRASGFRRCAG